MTSTNAEADRALAAFNAEGPRKRAPARSRALRSDIGRSISESAPSRDLGSTLALLCPDSQGPSAIIDTRTFSVRFLNASASRVLGGGYPLKLDRGALSAASKSHAARLRRAVQEVSSGAGGGLLILRDADGSLAVHLSSLPGTQPGPVALVRLEFPTDRLEASPIVLEAMAAGFGLSPAETVIVGHLVDGLDLNEVARARGVRIGTVRSQCNALLAKTGCRRQVDLVRLVLALGRAELPRMRIQPAA